MLRQAAIISYGSFEYVVILVGANSSTTLQIPNPPCFSFLGHYESLRIPKKVLSSHEMGRNLHPPLLDKKLGKKPLQSIYLYTKILLSTKPNLNMVHANIFDLLRYLFVNTLNNANLILQRLKLNTKFQKS